MSLNASRPSTPPSFSLLQLQGGSGLISKLAYGEDVDFLTRRQRALEVGGHSSPMFSSFNSPLFVGLECVLASTYVCVCAL